MRRQFFALPALEFRAFRTDPARPLPWGQWHQAAMLCDLSDALSAADAPSMLPAAATTMTVATATPTAVAPAVATAAAIATR